MKYRIYVIESERGWGQDSWTEDFDTPEEAWARIEQINGENTSPVAPDWYMQARERVEVIKD